MAITLSDIARHCGKDASTVSRALRNDERVKPETRALVQKAAADLGYVPNLAARNLRAGKTRTIWCIVPSLENHLERGPAMAASRYAAEAGYDLMVSMHLHDEEIYRRLLTRLHQRVADGAIIIPGFLEPDIYRSLVQERYPLVFLDRHPEGLSVPVVTTDNRGAAAELVRQCAAQDIASCISLYGAHNAVERARRDGALDELGRRQIPVLIPDEGTIPPETAARLPERIGIVATQHKALRQFLADNADVLKGKTMFFGVFDGWSGEPYPAEKVFTCRQDFTTMAHLAVDRILDMLNNGTDSRPEIVRVPVESFETVERTY